MAIGVEATTVNGDTAGRGSASFSHDGGSGDDRGLFVCCKLRDDANAGVSAITYNGVGLTKALDVEHEYTAGQWINVEWWYLANPASGSNTLAITYSHTLTADEVTAVTLSGVDQVDPLGASQGATGTGNPSVTLTTEEDNSWVLLGAANRRAAASGYTPGSGTTELADGETGSAGNADIGYFDGYEVQATAGSVTADATYASNSEWAAGGIEVNEASGGATAVAVLAMHYRKL